METREHTFAICAYGESPYLRECVESVLGQDHPMSEVFVATSTPSEYIDSIAGEYGLPVHVNTGESGIGQDWNFAYSCATGTYVTIAHQDDIYLPGYAHEAVTMMNRSEYPLIFFSNYGELRDGKRVDDNQLLRVKRRLLKPLEKEQNFGNVRKRRRALSLGSAICCPSVCISREACPGAPFVTGMQSNLDWDTWEVLSRREGDFCYSPKILMYHRVHEESTTSKLIQDNTRGNEDLAMFRRFWPAPVAKTINWVYSRGMKSNSL